KLRQPVHLEVIVDVHIWQIVRPKLQKKPVNFEFKMNNKVHVQKQVLNQPNACGVSYRVPIEDELRNIIKTQDLFLDMMSLSNSVVESHCTIKCSVEHFCYGQRYPKQLLFILLYSLTFLIGTGLLSNAITLGASIGFAALPRPDMFGHQRVAGTIGFGISAFLASRLFKIFKTEFVYLFLFIFSSTLCIITTSFIRINYKRKQISDKNEIKIEEEMQTIPLPADDYIVNNTIKNENKKSLRPAAFNLGALLPLLKKIDVLVFLLLTFVWGMSYAVMDPYLYLFVDEIAPCSSHTIIGWMSLISSASEVCALFSAGYILEKLGTNFSAVIILLAFGVRFAGYFFIQHPIYYLPMETMHFFNFGILYVLMSKEADAIAPPGLASTLQGIAYGLSFGLGRGIGLLISSFIYTLIYARSLFLIFSIFNFVCAILYSIYSILRKRTKVRRLTAKETVNNQSKIIFDQ
ncbi:unnamed protein product, partial [Didymodactylos carnosus]